MTDKKFKIEIRQTVVCHGTIEIVANGRRDALLIANRQLNRGEISVDDIDFDSAKTVDIDLSQEEREKVRHIADTNILM